MQNIIRYGLIIGVMGGVATGFVQAAPVAIYLFDEGTGATATDSSGNGNDGMIVGATYVAETPFSYDGDSALEFVNPNDWYFVPGESYVTVVDAPSLRPVSGLTVEAWIKAFPGRYRRHIVSKQLGDGPADSYVLWYDGDQTVRFAVHDGARGYAITAGIPSFNEWHHIAGVWDGAFMRLYVDGIEVAAAPFSGPIVYDTNPVLIGAEDNGADDVPEEGWVGIIDEVVIHDRGLTPEEILATAQESARSLAIVSVDVDLKPGSDPNSINLGSKGVLPVAILTTENFDALDVVDVTVELGDPELAGTAAPIRSAEEDVDGDELVDLLLFFSVPELAEAGALDDQSEEAVLMGETLDGVLVMGIDSVRIVPPKGEGKSGK